MSKKWKFDSFQKDQASIYNEVEIITSKDTGTVNLAHITENQYTYSTMLDFIIVISCRPSLLD